MGSLQDQLLKSGLTTEHKMKVAKTEKRKQQKKKKKGATSNPSELEKHIQKTRQEQQQKAEELNKAKLAEQKDKEQVARVKQILQHNNQDSIRGEVTFNFTYLNKIKELDVTAATQKALAGGRLAICVFEEKFYALAHLLRHKIAEVDEKYIVFHVTDNEEKDQDDPYADFEVPDDLIW